MKKVCIDVGHGGTDPGAMANGLIEKNLNMTVAKKTRELLKKYDVEVIMTREADKSLTPDERVRIVQNFNPDLCVSIHHNFSLSNARGAEVIHAHYDLQDDELANDILTRLANAGMPPRRAFSRLDATGKDYYFMIRRVWDNNTDAIIVEGGFIDNVKDAALLKSEYYLNAEARAIADSVVDYLKLSPRAVIDPKVAEAINFIYTEGIINSPTFWLTNSIKGKTIPGELVGLLIVKLTDAYKAATSLPAPPPEQS